MVEAVRRGRPQRAVARQWRVSLATVQYWLRRARGRRLERVDWADRPAGPRRPRRTPRAVEDRILALRRELQETSVLGECGGGAIQRAWRARWRTPSPALRTIGRILVRRGALDGQRRVRRAPPPRGWYLPAVAAGRAELDSVDIVEGLVLKGGPEVEVLTGLSLHGGVPAAWPQAGVTAAFVVAALIAHWRAQGLPAYAQFDNDTRFQGPHQFTDVVGRVTRLCLSLGVVPVFVPVQEPGFQGALEQFNGRWQAKVWARFRHASLAALQTRSVRYVAAYRRRVAARADAAPVRRPFPARWRLDLRTTPRGRLVFLRRTDAQGRMSLLGHTVTVHRHWPHRLVRAEVTLPEGPIRCFALRRRDPASQPLLRQADYQLPRSRRALEE